MIYLVTNNPDFPLNPVYEVTGLQTLLDWLTPRLDSGFDLETTGLDPRVDKIISAQLGDVDTQFVVDAATVDIRQLRDHLLRLILVGHNLKFDLQFLFVLGIYPYKVYDSFVAEKVLNCGLPQLRASLEAVALRYLQVQLNKDVRNHISREGLTPRVIKYGADDVKHLYPIKAAQAKIAQERDLEKTIKLENAFTPALTYLEFSGFRLNKKAWLDKMAKDEAEMLKCRELLDSWVAANCSKYNSAQADLFSDVVESSVDWNSPKQVVPFMEHIGVDCKTYVNGEYKKSVEESVIAKFKKSHPAVNLYLNYKGAQKNVSTYGHVFIDSIHPKTGKIHTRFDQIKDTGRISSGGKDGKRRKINFQNIPKDKHVRACFAASSGHKLIIADYTGQEQIVLANFSMDPGLLHFYDEGLGDMHSFVASKMPMWPELVGMSLAEIKDKHADKRDKAKTGAFAINYGGDGATIAENMGISEEEGNAIYNAYFEAFPGLKKYFNQVQQENLNRGYILISNLTGRKCFLPYYEKFQALRNQMTKAFWAKYREIKQECETHDYYSPEFKSLKAKVREFFSMQGEIGRMSLNYPIQGSSAEITKMAAIYFLHWLIEKNYMGLVWICNMVHDEIVLDCPEELVEESKAKLIEVMEKAGRFFCKRVPLKVSVKVSDVWEK